MSTERKLSTSHRLVATVLVSAVFVPGAAASNPPEPGTTCELPVVSVSLSVGSTEKETKRVVYAPPPGWYVRSHRIVTANRSGSVAYSVGTVPAGWNWVADERMAASGRMNGTAGVTLPHTLVAGGQLAGAQDSTMVDRQANTSSHHVLVVDVTAKGAGFWRGGGSVDLTVYADLVYLGK